MNFVVDDSNIFELSGTNGRFLHLATIRKSVREYMLFVDTTSSKCYIEEITGGHLEFIEDDNLAFDLAKFCEQKGLSSPLRVSEYLMNKQKISDIQKAK